MVIRDEKEYKDYEARMEKLIEQGTELGDMELLSPEEKAEFTMLSEALDEVWPCLSSTAWQNAPRLS